MSDNKNESLILGMTEKELLNKITSLATHDKAFPILDREAAREMIFKGEYPLNLLTAIYRDIYWVMEGMSSFDKYFNKYGINEGLDALIELIGKKNGDFIDIYFKNKEERAIVDKLEEFAIFPNAINKAMNQSVDKMGKALISQSKFIVNIEIVKEDNESKEEIDLD